MILSGATPLAVLEAVALDTETTGLDAANDRIVQVGAVIIRRGAGSADTFDRLVDPGVPIPPGATAIHHITNAMVRNERRFADVWRDFSAFAQSRILVGYSIGFDLAVLAREAERAGMRWEKPRSLCVRLLAATANSRLPDYSLEALASWLGVPADGRHSALGDARMAAGIFAGLVPHLAERGIRTLAEAERAVLGLTQQLENHHRAGWAEPVTRPDPARAFVSVDPYAYRHRLADLMSAPPAVMRAGTPVAQAMEHMLKRRISSLFVSEAGEPGAAVADYGIVTERDVMRHLAASGAAGFAAPVGSIATRPLVSIRAAAFAYRAIGRMDRLKIRHLAVRDEQGRLVGVVSARDLLKLRAAAAINLDDAIEVASTATELAAAWSSLPSVAQSLIAEDVEAPVVAEIVSEELRAMTRRAALLAETEMLAEGLGRPPCAYAVLVLGSGGRGESLLAADQDNAIVFAEGVPDGPEDFWFAAFGTRFTRLLDRAGIPLCKGGVMASNAPWRGSIATWEARIADWVRRSRPEDLLNVDIFYDLRPVFGDHELSAALCARALELAAGEVAFAKGLGERAAAPVNPFTLLGSFRTEHGRIDLKRHGLFPVVAFARALAIRHGIAEVSTRGRLQGLVAVGVGSAPELNRLAEAHGVVLRAMLHQQARDLLAGIVVSNRVDPSDMEPRDQAALKTALRTIQLVPDMVRALMFA
jgi:DNA polymerase-3 subunit epsilon/CBS domain-containing protein